MNTKTGLDRRAAAWMADGPTELSDRVLDAALREVHLTHQRRVLVPWRFPLMSAISRSTALAAVVLVAVLGAGAAVYFNSPSGFGARVTPAPTPAPTAAPTTAPSFPPGITGWTSYTSKVHGFTLGYPDDWTLEWAATREWQAGDTIFDAAKAQFADVFAAPEKETVGLFVWEMPAGEGADVESLGGLKAWATTFCNDAIAESCAAFAQQAVPMCLNVGGDSCRAAILVPTATGQFAFFVNWGTALLTTSPDRVRVVTVAREDSFPSAARYGGSVALLKAILTTMDVWTPGQVPPAN